MIILLHPHEQWFYDEYIKGNKELESEVRWTTADQID